MILDRKGVQYTHIDVTDDHKNELIMRERANASSVPQIFVNDRSIGGYDDIAALEAKGELDGLLAQQVAINPVQRATEGGRYEQVQST
jgi:glutaredoxin 3